MNPVPVLLLAVLCLLELVVIFTGAQRMIKLQNCIVDCWREMDRLAQERDHLKKELAAQTELAEKTHHALQRFVELCAKNHGKPQQ